jgi:chromosome segregation ATPase
MAGIKSITMLTLMILGLCGCTVMALKNEVKTDEKRVAVKEDELKVEQAREAQLREEITRLESELATKQMSLADLKSGLTQLQRANDATLAKTKAQQAAKRDLAAKLQKHQREVAAIEQIEQSGAKSQEKQVQEKQERVQFLKEEIRKMLKVLQHT